MHANQDLNLPTLLLILVTMFMLAGGQVLFKYAADGIEFGNARTYFSLPLMSALAMYGLATVMWLGVLSRVPLSVAFPFYGLGFLIVPLLSVLILGEKLRWSMLVGGVVILIGISISARDW